MTRRNWSNIRGNGVNKMRLKYDFIVEMIALYFVVAVGCQSGPRDLKAARTRADYDFYQVMFEDRVDTKYYDGPLFFAEKDSGFVFRWVSNIPGVTPAILEGYVPKDPKDNTGFKTIQSGAIGLGGTLDYPLSEAALCGLFRLPLNNSPEVLRLRKVPLTLAQLEDVTRMTNIRADISDYAYCFNCAYPDSLSWLKNIKQSRYRDYCTVKQLDSVYTHDRYGYEYCYQNYIIFVLLGTPGANRKWDFDQAVMDSIYHDNKEHIYVNNDDIIAKVVPKSPGCD